MRSPSVVLLAAIVLTGHVTAETDMTTMSILIPHWSVNYMARQATPTLVPTSTTSFNWWPYPPGGVVTSTSTPSIPTNTQSGPSEISSASDIIMTGSLSTISLPNPNTAEHLSSSPVTSSLSIIHITALPPANTSSPPGNLHKLKPPSSFHITYLVPLFAILGIILGSATAWFCYGFVTAGRGPRERADSLEPGPPYVASPRDSRWEYDEKDGRMETVPLTNDGGSPSKYTSHGSPYYRQSRNGSGSWIGRALSSRTNNDDKSFAWPTPGPTPGLEAENPFLVVPSRGLSTRTKASTGKSISIYSPNPLSLMDEGDDDYEDVDMVPYESLRHKSVRRDLLERLKIGTIRRTVAPLNDKDVALERAESGMAQSNRSFRRPRHHQRADSDFRVDEPSRPGNHSSDSYRREEDSERPTSNGDEVAEWVEGSGFRIVEEHLDKIRDQVRDGDWGNSMRRQQSPAAGPQTPTKNRSSPTVRSPDGNDKYTALPVRKSPTKGRSPHISTPASTPRRGGICRVDSSILPMSPPQITSPPLESTLFFQSPPNSAQTGARRMILTTPKKATTTTASARSIKMANTLHSPTPPRFPSPNEGSPYRNRLVKTTTQKDLPLTPPRRSTPNSTPSSSEHRVLHATPTRRGTPAERFIARHGALNKVDQIVSRSWSQRDLTEVEKEVGSPNMFGAQVDSVQERLATLEER